MSSDTSRNDANPREATPREPGLRPARLAAALAAGGAAVLTVCILFLTTNSGSIWPFVGLIGVVCLLGVTALCLTIDADHPPTKRRRSLAALAGVAGLSAVVAMIAVRLFVPASDQTVLVQFSDPSGRVVIEYCPTLPSSFEAQARPADVAGTASTIPVRVTADICGNPEFNDGIWLYLQRSGVTIAMAAS